MFRRLYDSLKIKKAIECYDRVKSFRIASRYTGISKSTIHRWYKTFHSMVIRQRVQIKKKKRNRRPKYPCLLDQLANTFSTSKLQCFSLKDIQSKLSMENQEASLSWIRYCLSKCKVSRRRFQLTKVCPRSPEDIEKITKTFSEIFNTLSNDEIVCVDETGFSNVGNNHYGYFSKGKMPIVTNVRKRQRHSVVMAIQPSGVISWHHQDKPFNAETFFQFIESLQLPPTVKVLLMDNVAFHKTRKLQKIVEGKGLKLLFIPPYSPRCNPIEEVFSLVKRHFRTLTVDNSVLENLVASVNNLNRNQSFQEYYNHTRHYLQNFGY